MTWQESTHPEDRPVRDEFRRGRDEAREVGSEFGEMANDLRYLVQKEAELARAEFQEAVSRVIQSAISAVVAVVFVNLMLIFAFVTVMFGLDTVFELWLAALITTGIIFVVALAAFLFAYARMKAVSFTPERTLKSLREDVEWAKTQMQSTAR